MVLEGQGDSAVLDPGLGQAVAGSILLEDSEGADLDQVQDRAADQAAVSTE